ncbi:helicase-exonuclease AddAB, AddA subunit [Enterococcus haemoperoxidus ATCC BAA-382]|uniref:ATP-dependent helicase/nuclease subunit A n=2 Tax=Enterococcus haemoperoxidus TaxID=155618 RepID=R2QPP7_9ENTE|nr:helicase-exonuclease AddAB, AddA subunit [Enterococcus haemoperoxidus ATCC BAA-382]EOT62360.1 helicase-exonuclease AddAB, AddA subunit [Enterococcus haemoperoxidus ATCC BAA-382]
MMSKIIPLRPENEQFTDNQWQAVFDGDENILVSASAGSGKTTVLVRRVIEKLKSGTDIDRLLIVTYTEAAAKEMKERIQVALQKAITNESEQEKKQHFIKQLSLLPTANISTLHAFCLTVIRRFYYLIEMDPVFRLLTDETEMLLLKEDVWDELREKFYADNEETFYQLTSNFSNDRSDDGLTKLVFSLYEFARANPDPDEWLAHLADSYRVDGQLGDSALFQEYLKPQVMDSLLRCVDRYEEMIRMTEGEEKLAKIATLARYEKEFVETFTSQLADNDLESGFEISKTVTFERYPTVRAEDYKEIAAQAKNLREQNKKAINDIISNLFTLSPEQMKEILEQSQPLVQEMAKVGKAFIDSYSKQKLRKGLVDFNDLEHFTLAILAKNEAGVWLASEASNYYREKFDEVLVDEYQDINRLQETILYWLRRPTAEEGNLFMVGDVKQSIYSFRLADPTLFIEKYNQYGQNKDGKRIVLAENFRSRKNVLDFTNLVFEQLMDERVGQIAYDDAAQLVHGFDQFAEAENYDTELLIYEKKSEQLEETLKLDDSQLILEDKTEGELHMTALKIRELIDNKFLIYDKSTKENRPLTYKDIVLLTPTKKNNLTILEIFKLAGIPIQVNDAQNYFQATEVQTMVALLQIIDNPYQDIPLAAVLRSPIVGLRENELVTIRLAAKKSSYYEAFLTFNQTDTDDSQQQSLKEKTTKFAEWLEQWREIARRNQLSTLIWQIYQDTAYLDYVGGMPAGKQRQANLFALVDRANSYEQTSFRGLFQFVRFIEKMQEKDKDLAEPVILSEENAVRVMTIHASKGLEFPVVFILDMTKEFNLGDLNERYIFDDRLGVGIRYLDQTDRMLYETLPFLAIKQAKLKKLLSEEMRKLYVALTRAEQKLYLVGSYNNQEATFKEWLKIADVQTKVLPSENRLQGKSSLMNWVGMSLVRHRKMAEFQTEFVTEKIAGITQHPASFSISFMTEKTIQEQFAALQFIDTSAIKEVETKKSDSKSVEEGLRRLNYEYPYQLSTKTTNYQSVSEIKRVFEDPDNKEIAKIEVDEKNTIQPTPMIIHRMSEGELGKPRFIETIRKPSAVEIGTATHYLLQLLDMKNEPTKESIIQLIDELIKTKIIQENVAKQINVEQVLSFYQTSLGQLLLENPAKVIREQPFSMLLKAEELIKDYPKETQDDLLIHGMIDGYVEQEESCILYDYKTDFVQDIENTQEIKKIIQRYRGQLNLYRKALAQATSKEVNQVLLVLLSAGIIIDMDKEQIIEKMN